MSLIGKNIGNYQIRAKLGEGGMGTVYLAEHPLIGKRVAIKVLLEELSSKQDIVDRFFDEAKAVNQIHHENIVDVVDFGRVPRGPQGGGDLVYFIMEYLEGESLAARLRRTGLTFSETLHVVAQCASALAASHVKNIIHRDIKPENIFLCPRGNEKNFVKILDFGIAKLTGGSTGNSHKTRTGLVIGTPAYMSPEQCEGKGEIDARSDIYSLGVVMYELITGRVPFHGEGFGEMLVSHLTKEPPTPSSLNPDVTPEIEGLVLHAIQKDKTKRFQSMEEFEVAARAPKVHSGGYKLGTADGRDAATRASSTPVPSPQGPISTTLSGAASELRSAPGRRRGPIFAGFLVALGVFGGVMVALKGLRQETPAQAGEQRVASPQGQLMPEAHKTEGHQEEKVPEAVKPAEPVKPVLVTVSVRSTPAGARLVRADRGVVGTTPFEFKLAPGEESFDVLVHLDGYQDQTRTVVPNDTHEIVVKLRKIEPDVDVRDAVPVPVSNRSKPESQPRESQPRESQPRKKDKPKKTSDGDDDLRLLQPKF